MNFKFSGGEFSEYENFDVMPHVGIYERTAYLIYRAFVKGEHAVACMQVVSAVRWKAYSQGRRRLTRIGLGSRTQGQQPLQCITSNAQLNRNMAAQAEASCRNHGKRGEVSVDMEDMNISDSGCCMRTYIDENVCC